MKTKSIPNLKFKDLGNDAFSVSTPTEHISLNSVILLVAKKQSGKTFFASSPPQRESSSPTFRTGVPQKLCHRLVAI